MNKLFVCVGLILVSAYGYAFEKQTIVYTVNGDSSNPISFNFNGKKFSPYLDVQKEAGQAPDVLRFQRFLNRMWEVNKQGDKNSILSIWSPNDRSTIASQMTSEALQANREKFIALKNVRIKMIMAFGAYYVAYAEYEFHSSTKVTFKIPIEVQGEQLFLTNALNGNYFYDQVSDFIQ